MLQMNFSAWAGLPKPTKESVARALPWEHPLYTLVRSGDTVKQYTVDQNVIECLSDQSHKHNVWQVGVMAI